MIIKNCLARWQFGVFLYFFILVSLSGCAAKMAVTPQITDIEIESDFQLGGVVEYDGNKDYLPRTIKEDPSQTLFSFRYDYQVAYGRDKTPQAIPLYNPLTIVGFPIGDNTMVVTANLAILKGKEVVKAYTATCGLEQVRSLFSEGETFSELRKKGLVTVRDNIELQIYRDRDLLSSLASSD